MTPPNFYGSYEVALDDKNRVQIPAPIRKAIKPEVHGSDFILVPSDSGRPWLYCSLHYDYLANQEEANIAIGREVAQTDLRNFALAEPLDVDRQGRLLLPARTFEWTGLQRNAPVYVCGVRNHIELWDKAAWENKRRALLVQAGSIVVTPPAPPQPTTLS